MKASRSIEHIFTPSLLLQSKMVLFLKFNFGKSIGVQFLRTVFSCYLLITIVLTSCQLYVEYNAIEKELMKKLEGIANSFEKGVGKALWNIDNDSIAFILAGIKKIDIISGVKVTNLQNDLQGAVGIYIDDQGDFLNADEVNADDLYSKVVVRQDSIHNYYEYTLGIFFEGSTGKPELIGFMSLYANHSSVVLRFRQSLIFIIFIAFVKTLALWLIFLYFAKNIVAQPLTELASAAQALSKSDKRHRHPYNISRLELLARPEKNDEISLLAKSFLEMQNSVLEQINNLYCINDMAINLSQATTTKQVFEFIAHHLKTKFGCQFAVIFDRTNRVFWSSIEKSELPLLTMHHFADNPEQFKKRLYERSIIYSHHPTASAESLERDNIPTLTLPISATGFEGKYLRFFGALNADRLTIDLQLTKETKSFLQVVSVMIGNTLTNLNQREVIEQQNELLEERVDERTRELADVNAELKHLAVHDPLTQLPNRTLFNDRLEQLIHLSERENRCFAVASIDLTKFKMINDNYGHDAGDAVLIEISRRFSNALRGTDTLARMGGDEFAALLSDTYRHKAIDTIMRQLIASLDKPITLDDGTEIMPNANIGIALYPDHAITGDQLFKYADIAMYHAKRNDNGYGIFCPTKNLHEQELTELMNDLELAIARQELVLHYQPIVDIKTKTVCGFEALIRWIHPIRGKIPPNMFIPHAEKSRHIGPLTQWVLREACIHSVRLDSAGFPIPISVNLSPRVFTSPELPHQLALLLDEYALDPCRIKLEITENAAMTNPNEAMEIISKFSAMGSPISIDDFGTGHSSLAYLTRLPLNELKIDRTFLTVDSASNRVVVETIIELAHALDLKVVAEGIETQETYEMLKAKGCDYAQGFYFGRPIDADKVMQLLGTSDANALPMLPKTI